MRGSEDNVGMTKPGAGRRGLRLRASGWKRATHWLVLAWLAPALMSVAPATPHALGLSSAVVPVVGAEIVHGPQGYEPPSQPAPVAWQALPHGGLNGTVNALAAVGNDLYVGGFFTETADEHVKDLNGVALLSGGQ